MHVKWSEIESFHNVRKSVEKYPELLGGDTGVTYRGKVKLHGTNAAVQVRGGDKVFAQSRTRYITPGDDNCGFAAWVEKFRVDWLECWKGRDFVVFGEWCGPGIMKGTACNQMREKAFAIFGMRFLDDEDRFVSDPDEIKAFLEPVLEFVRQSYVIPWEGPAFALDFVKYSKDLMQEYLDGINSEVARIEACDPFIYDLFEIEGTGEGLVYYPISHKGRKHFSDLAFKAKGEKHKVVKTRKAVQLDPEVVASIEAFVGLFVTEARLEQGARAINRGELEFDNKLIGPFIGWLGKDVKKESADELEASGLEWKQVAKAVTTQARVWYMERIEEL